MAFVYAWIVPLWADQLLPQLLIEQFDSLPIQCRHIEHMHEGNLILCQYNVDTLNICMKEFIIFVCTDSNEIVQTKVCWFELKLAKFFSLTLTVRGVSNKHCLLTFFIFQG